MKGFKLRPFHVILLALLILGILAWVGMRWFVVGMVLPDFIIGDLQLAHQQIQLGKPGSLHEAEETFKMALKQSEMEYDAKKPLKQSVLKAYIDFLKTQHREKEAEPLSSELARLQAQ